jgi:hypothetical protein
MLLIDRIIGFDVFILVIIVYSSTGLFSVGSASIMLPDVVGTTPSFSVCPALNFFIMPMQNTSRWNVLI